MGLVGCFGADSQVELGPNMSIAWGLLTHRGQTSIFTLIANSGSLHKFDNSCTARIFSLHDFQTILNAKAYGCRGSLHPLDKNRFAPGSGPGDR